MAQQQMDEFWMDRQKDIEAIEDYSEHAIPMARLKKIVSSQKGNMMMTFDMPAFLSKMCELFVQELAIRAWACAQSYNRCIILETDIAQAVASTESYDFLVDVLHKHRVKHNSSPYPIITTKRCRLVDQPSTSHLPHQQQLSQFAPTYTPSIPKNPSLMPQISQYRPFSFPSFISTTPIVNGPILSIHNIARSLGLQENNTNAVTDNNVQDNIVDCSSPTILANVMNPTLLSPTGSPLDIPDSQSSMRMMGMINSIVAGGSSTSNIVVANEESLALPGHFKSPFLLQSPCPTFLPGNNNDMDVVIPERIDINDTMHVVSDVVDATVTVLNDQQERHDKETNVEYHEQNGIYERVDAEMVNANTADGDKCNISWDELGMAEDSLLDMFLDELQERRDDVLDARIVLNENPCLDETMFSNPNTSNVNN
uniref:Core Histone H2A/H2B/H3 domain-containing protein n=1 Tax=Leersia perrieri TaxID=77586 RepID=A0A0D9WPM1_9ORYZ